MISLRWPATPATLLPWALLLLTWVVANYYVGSTSSIWGRPKPASSERWQLSAIVRAVLLTVVTFWLFGRRFGAALALTTIAIVLSLALSWARARGRDSWRAFGAEFELGSAAAFTIFSALIVGDCWTRPRPMLVLLPISEGRAAALAIALALILFVINGGTQVVRAVLNKANAAQSDETEYNRGRLIGSLERVLLLALVSTGNWAAMGFVIAAKGVVRSKDNEKREFAEYFLVGTLTSTALAILAGWLIRAAFLGLW